MVRLYIDKKLPQQPAESYYGNKEYKWKWVHRNKTILNKRATQLLFRLVEGKGKAVYILGILDDGTPIGISHEDLNDSIAFLYDICNVIEARCNSIRIYNGNIGYIATIRIYKNMSHINESSLI
jgi:GTPase